MPGDDAAKLNPKVKTLDIGIRNPMTITLYPLSVAGQFRMTDLITDAFNSAMSMTTDDARNPMAWVTTIVGTLQRNSAESLTLATCGEHKGEDLLEEIDNDQFLEVMEIIFEVNYQRAIEKAPLLADKYRHLFERKAEGTHSKKPAPMSSNDTPDTPSETSTNEASSKAA